jgi:hypothetical protein
MHIIYARQDLSTVSGPIIFLAGPTPRMTAEGTVEIESWRPAALNHLQDLGFSGTVLVPECASWGLDENTYETQVEWEEAGLNLAHCIVFWIPRRMDLLPGMTTNDEWGVWKQSGKVVLGVPRTAERCRYQLYYAKKLGVPHFETLGYTVFSAMLMAQKNYSSWFQWMRRLWRNLTWWRASVRMSDVRRRSS